MWITSRQGRSVQLSISMAWTLWAIGPVPLLYCSVFSVPCIGKYQTQYTTSYVVPILSDTSCPIYRRFASCHISIISHLRTNRTWSGSKSSSFPRDWEDYFKLTYQCSSITESVLTTSCPCGILPRYLLYFSHYKIELVVHQHKLLVLFMSNGGPVKNMETTTIYVSWTESVCFTTQSVSNP